MRSNLIGSCFSPQAQLYILAAHFARAMLASFTLSKKEGTGRTGRRLAPIAPVQKNCTRNAQEKPQVKPKASRPSPRQWFYDV